uniref:Uncharacterized protein n=1 Tax=Acrobeloides nanus TaxID=290746 RepID=A0A914C5T7_9BILA
MARPVRPPAPPSGSRRPPVNVYVTLPQEPGDERRGSVVAQYFAALPKMVCCFCCCPVFKCAIWLCILEFVVSIYAWYTTFNLLILTFEDLQIKDVVVLLMLTGWLIALCSSSGALIAAQYKKKAHWVLPRLILQAGLLIIGFLVLFVEIAYFSGASQRINGWVIWIYESFLDEPLTKEHRKEIHNELKNIALVLLMIVIAFIVYMALGLCATRKFQKDLERDYPQFRLVSGQAPSAPPQPPTNPNYPKAI